jgi:hypothetical protein
MKTDASLTTLSLVFEVMLDICLQVPAISTMTMILALFLWVKVGVEIMLAYL